MPVLAAFVVVVLQPGNSLPQPADNEEREESEREPLFLIWGIRRPRGTCVSTTVRLGVTYCALNTENTFSSVS